MKACPSKQYVEMNGPLSAGRLLLLYPFELFEVTHDGVDDDGGVACDVAFAEIENAALVGAADGVHDEPADGAEIARWEIACVDGLLQDLDEAALCRAEERRGLFAMLGFAADGEDHVVHVAARAPEVEPCVDPCFNAAACVCGFGDTLVGKLGEVVDGVL